MAGVHVRMASMHARTARRLHSQKRATTPTRAHDMGIECTTGLGLGLGYLGHDMNLDVATWP